MDFMLRPRWAGSVLPGISEGRGDKQASASECGMWAQEMPVLGRWAGTGEGRGQ